MVMVMLKVQQVWELEQFVFVSPHFSLVPLQLEQVPDSANKVMHKHIQWSMKLMDLSSMNSQ